LLNLDYLNHRKLLLKSTVATKSIEDVNFEKDETYITDGSERPIQRDTYQQEEY